MESLQSPEEQVEPPTKIVWEFNRRQKDAGYYAQQQGKYEKYMNGNEFLTIPDALYAVTTMTITLLIIDVKT